MWVFFYDQMSAEQSQWIGKGIITSPDRKDRNFFPFPFILHSTRTGSQKDVTLRNTFRQIGIDYPVACVVPNRVAEQQFNSLADPAQVAALKVTQHADHNHLAVIKSLFLPELFGAMMALQESYRGRFLELHGTYTLNLTYIATDISLNRGLTTSCNKPAVRLSPQDILTELVENFADTRVGYSQVSTMDIGCAAMSISVPVSLRKVSRPTYNLLPRLDSVEEDFSAQMIDWTLDQDKDRKPTFHQAAGVITHYISYEPIPEAELRMYVMANTSRLYNTNGGVHWEDVTFFKHIDTIDEVGRDDPAFPLVARRFIDDIKGGPSLLADLIGFVSSPGQHGLSGRDKEFNHDMQAVAARLPELGIIPGSWYRWQPPKIYMSPPSGTGTDITLSI